MTGVDANLRSNPSQPAGNSRSDLPTDSIIDDALINSLLEQGAKAAPQAAIQTIRKALDLKGLAPDEAAILLQSEGTEFRRELYRAAGQIKDRIYGNRLVLFAPLYLSNHCGNNCLYCGYRRDNRLLERRLLSQDEIAEQVRILERMGHKRLLLECGESPGRSPIDFVIESIRTVYATKEGNGSIRRVNVNIASTVVADYQKLKAAGIGTYQLFQETYHRPTYARMHLDGPKADYDWHLTAMDRAMQAGIDDVGLGVLFGLADYKYEVLGLLLHAIHLERTYGVGPHTISVPRWRPAVGVDFALPQPVSDDDFRKLVAVLRLSVPYTGMIISTRESPEMRDELFGLGISQFSAASSTSPGGYRVGETPKDQFVVADHRSVDEMVEDVCRKGYLPSFCTACYRQGRTGEAFMTLAKPGNIQELCRPNALLTFREYLEDYAPPSTREVGQETVRAQLALIENAKVRQETKLRLARIEAGERDLFF
ncbi:MAG: [FeFe] hydrogenase H-cluster radical SAM maturase HydG [Chloroflexota bacterium]